MPKDAETDTKRPMLKVKWPHNWSPLVKTQAFPKPKSHDMVESALDCWLSGPITGHLELLLAFQTQPGYVAP